MFDGIYQSLMSFFMPYLLYKPANFVTSTGRDLADRTRIGVLVATAAVMSSNFYIMLNSYRWDWLTMLINAISSLLVFFWTGIYTAAQTQTQFYGAGREVYGTLSFWATLLVTVVLCLLPRFAAKSVQKVFFPRDIDIIREQATQGTFKYLEAHEEYVPPPTEDVGFGEDSDSGGYSDLAKPVQPSMKQNGALTDEEPIIHPTVSPFATFDNPSSQNGSVTTNYASSLDRYHSPQSAEYTLDRNRPSFERIPRSEGNEFINVDSLSHPNSRVPPDLENPFRLPHENVI